MISVNPDELREQPQTDERVPRLGDAVAYVLTDADVAQILSQRHATKLMGSPVHAGMVYPGIVVATWGKPSVSSVNLRLLLDGHDSPPWLQGVSHGWQRGCWHWPS